MATEPEPLICDECGADVSEEARTADLFDCESCLAIVCRPCGPRHLCDPAEAEVLGRLREGAVAHRLDGIERATVAEELESIESATLAEEIWAMPIEQVNAELAAEGIDCTGLVERVKALVERLTGPIRKGETSDD